MSFRTVLSKEHGARLAVHEDSLERYTEILKLTQCRNVEFSIEDGVIRLFGQTDGDMLVDIENALDEAVGDVPESQALKLVSILREGQIRQDRVQLVGDEVISFFSTCESLLSAFVFLVACGISEDLTLEQVGFEECNYVTHRVKHIQPIEDIYRAEKYRH